MLLEYDAADQEKAWKLDTDECLFAYTYLRKATFREINFGETVTDSPFSIAGLSIKRRGFNAAVSFPMASLLLKNMNGDALHASLMPCRISITVSISIENSTPRP